MGWISAVQSVFPYVTLSSGYDVKRKAHVHSRQGSIADQGKMKSLEDVLSRLEGLWQTKQTQTGLRTMGGPGQTIKLN